ncbi:MAG: hypothetical protein IKM37_02200 [Alistipes sp.]|nr:hypothetical protein [Alistipes sp.]
MKKLLLLMSLCLIAATSFGQARKPRLMVVPSDNWCYQHGFVTEYNNQGVTEYIPDYRAALVKNPDLLPVISAINGLMADRGFPLENLESAMRSINRQSIELSAVSARDGSTVQSNELMELRRQAKADIILQLSWTVNEVGPRRSVTYTLQGLDSYTNNEVASAGGTGDPSFTVETPVLLREAAVAHMDEFCNRLQNHFDDLFANGRAVAIYINVYENARGIDLETEFDGKELREVIEDWMANNTVSGRYSLVDDNELYMQFDDVRIPVYDERGRSIAANQFARELVKFLRNAPYNITDIKLLNQGLGQVTLLLGNK